MFTFDAAYFDSAYFDTGGTPTLPKGGKHVKRMRPPVTGTPLPPSEEDEEFLALLEAFDG